MQAVSPTLYSTLMLLVATFDQVFMVVPLALSITVFTQLMRTEVRDWFTQRGDASLRP